MRLTYKMLISAGALGMMLVSSQSALARPSTNCFQLSQAIKNDTQALNACLRGGGSRGVCGDIRMEIMNLRRNYEKYCQGGGLPSGLMHSPAARPKANLKEWQR